MIFARFVFIFLLFYPVSLAAQESRPSNEKEPLEITADDVLEWHRADQKLIAKGNAKALQKTSSIEAQILSAAYREGMQGRFEISQINADENVIISTQNATAYGDHAVYNLDQSLATMTGENLRMISPDQTVTAEEKFEYYVDKGKLTAIGNAKVLRANQNGGNDTLEAHHISAIFKENAKGERVLESLEAKNNVVITTMTETITGAYGIYRADINKAEMKGNIIITRGPNILQGERAEIDLTTNTSRIFGGGQSNNGRVKAVFYPGSGE